MSFIEIWCQCCKDVVKSILEINCCKRNCFSMQQRTKTPSGWNLLKNGRKIDCEVYPLSHAYENILKELPFVLFRKSVHCL